MLSEMSISIDEREAEQFVENRARSKESSLELPPCDTRLGLACFGQVAVAGDEHDRRVTLHSKVAHSTLVSVLTEEPAAQLNWRAIS